MVAVLDWKGLESGCIDVMCKRAVLVLLEPTVRSKGTGIGPAQNECGVGEDDMGELYSMDKERRAVTRWKEEHVREPRRRRIKETRDQTQKQKSTRDESRRREGKVGDGVVEAKSYTSQCLGRAGAG